MCPILRNQFRSITTVGFHLNILLLLLGLRVHIQSKTGLTDNVCTANQRDPLAFLCFFLTCSLASLHSLLQSHIVQFTSTNILAVLGQHLVMDFNAVDYGTFITVSSQYQQLHINNLACPLPGHVTAQSCVSFHVDTSPRHGWWLLDVYHPCCQSACIFNHMHFTSGYLSCPTISNNILVWGFLLIVKILKEVQTIVFVPELFFWAFFPLWVASMV